MKFVALCLGVGGGLAGVALWLTNAMLICCALPPEYRRPVYPVDITPLVSGSVGNLIYLGTPLIAIAAMIAAVMLIVPRFESRTISRAVILCGVLLAICLWITYHAKQKPSDAAHFFPMLLWSIAPGVLVLIGGLLSWHNYRGAVRRDV